MVTAEGDAQMCESRLLGRVRAVALLGAVSLMLAGWMAAPALAEKTVVDPPIKALVPKVDGTRVAGRITAFDESGLSVRNDGGQIEQVDWSQLKSRFVYSLYPKLRKMNSGAAWFDLGVILLQTPDGQALSKGAFRKALQQDPGLQKKIDAAQAGAATPRPATPNSGQPPVTTLKPPAVNGNPGSGASPGGPIMEGGASGKAWPELTAEEHAKAVAGLKALAEEAKKRFQPKLQLYESDYFLFYTDLSKAEAKKWYTLLDKMYNRLLTMFNIPRKTNIWRGKALVFVFANANDFYRFERGMMGVPAGPGVAGLCHQKPDGDVIVSFYRQPDDMGFATVLVHEASHGFIWRYRAAINVPSWANEGLSEWIAYQLVPQSEWKDRRIRTAKSFLRTYQNLGGSFFQRSHIGGHQYGIAYTMTDFMIAANKKGYVKFINGIKAGTPWEQALKENFKSIDLLVSLYGQHMGVRDLKP